MISSKALFLFYLYPVQITIFINRIAKVKQIEKKNNKKADFHSFR